MQNGTEDVGVGGKVAIRTEFGPGIAASHNFIQDGFVGLLPGWVWVIADAPAYGGSREAEL